MYINMQLVLCAQKQTCAHRFLCFRGVYVVVVDHWFITPTRKCHTTCRNRLHFDYWLWKFVKDLCDCLGNLVANLQMCQWIFFVDTNLRLDLATKTKWKSWQKNKCGLKKMMELNPKWLDQKLCFVVLNVKQWTVCERNKPTSADFLSFIVYGQCIWSRVFRHTCKQMVIISSFLINFVRGVEGWSS